jgi:hypothetical protein
MAVQQILAPVPAAGKDWAYTVPGQWYPYLFGVTAVLTTASAVTVFPDETGNGWDLTTALGTLYGLGASGPFGAGAANYAVQSNLSGSGGVAAGNSVANAVFKQAAGTVDFWVHVDTLQASTFNGMVANFDTTTSTDGWAYGAYTQTANPWTLFFEQGGSLKFTVNSFASGSAWHHVAITWGAGTITYYVDGTLIGSQAGAPFWTGATGRMYVFGGRGASSAPIGGRMAGVAVYPVTLSAPQIAAHAGASGSWAAYRTAVLADAPTALWGLNTVPSGPSRIVTLKVTNGTTTVGQYPAAFTAATAQNFTWSWQALGPGAQASTDGTINSVPIPELRVDAGYVISAATLDLQATDQWSSVTLWFDDGTGQNPTTGGHIPPYLDALLVPTDWKGG